MIVSGSPRNYRRADGPNACASGQWVALEGQNKQAYYWPSRAAPLVSRRSSLTDTSSHPTRLNGLRAPRVYLSPLSNRSKCNSLFGYLRDNDCSGTAVFQESSDRPLWSLKSSVSSPKNYYGVAPRSLKVPCATGAADANASYHWRSLEDENGLVYSRPLGISNELLSDPYLFSAAPHSDWF